MIRTAPSRPPVAPLLPGEDRQSGELDDAEHWVAVYEELVSFLLSVQEPRPDRVVSYHRRLDYWRHRRDELAP